MKFLMVDSQPTRRFPDLKLSAKGALIAYLELFHTRGEAVCARLPERPGTCNYLEFSRTWGFSGIFDLDEEIRRSWER